ncbi:MAG: bifunctional 2-polyprenyl-6-hydroxyphenol methylase/3-demethylubiquinol 3-O-methyltransferase UbiG [Rhizomicrobium sp.]|jgi:2-polyprenyl-6-hydroxyphenyl methylase/3-demethylubiquinone-9 3-methyltransferase
MVSRTSQATSGSVDAAEVEKFSRIAAEWWDPSGKFAPLHKFNPIRIGLVRAAVAEHFGRDLKLLRPFDGLSLLDIGCGGGLLSEPMAKMGFAVTGVDPSEQNIGTALAHLAGSGLPLVYRCASAEQLAQEGLAFDVVLNMEVVEHVADLRGYLETCASLVKPGGLMFVATLNRTLKALALAKVAAEYILGWLPPGTHDWSRFVAPGELHAILESTRLNVLKTQGIVFDPLRWDWRLSSDTDVNYIVIASR